MPQTPLIQEIIYSNPDHYPPIINSVRLLAQHGFGVNIQSRMYDGVIPRDPVIYPPEVIVGRIEPRTKRAWKEYLQFVFQVLRKSDKSATVIIGHDMHGFLAAKLLSMRLRRPLIYHCHDYVERNAQVSLGGRIARAFEQRFARTADLVIVPDADRAKIMEQELRLKKPAMIVANAPLKAPSGSRKVLSDALAKQGKHFEKVVLRQGRIGEGHAIEVTLQSLKQWENPKWGFVLIGPSEPAYLEKIGELAQSLGVEEQFAVLPPVDYDELAHYTVGADIGHTPYLTPDINANFNTTASNKIMESMAAGLPLLVSDRPSLRALVEKYGCGLAVKETSAESFAEAINALLGDEEKSRRMGAAGKCAFEEVYCYQKQFAPALAAIREMCER